MVTAISTLPKLSPTRFVATGAADGSICVLNAETGAVYMTVKDFRRAASCCEIFESKERGIRRLLAADREGRVAIYDLDSKRLVAEKETDCGNVRGLVYLPSGNAFAMICASGALLVFDEMFNQLTFAHVGQGVAYARAVDATHLMVATENRELIAYNLTQANPEPVKVLKLTCKEPIRCFDLTADRKYAVIVSNEVEIWKLANQHCEANFSPTIPVRSISITSDYVSAKMFLNSIDPSLISIQGTAIGKALDVAMRSFTPQEGVGRAIVVITDGENHEAGALEAAQEAAKKGIRVFMLGIGSPDGAPIPLEGSNNYRKDRDGNVIVTRLNEQMCQEIAQAGNGMYIRVDNSNSAQRALNSEVNKMSKADVESKVYSEYNEQFQVIAWIALILLFAE